MSFPFVSRTAYDQALARFNDARKDLTDANERIDELMDTLTTLRRYGFDPERPVPTDDSSPPQVDDLPDEVQRVIDDLALPGEPLYRDLMRTAHRELRHSDADKVAQLIEAGADLDDY